MLSVRSEVNSRLHHPSWWKAPPMTERQRTCAQNSQIEQSPFIDDVGLLKRKYFVIGKPIVFDRVTSMKAGQKAYSQVYRQGDDFHQADGQRCRSRSDNGPKVGWQVGIRKPEQAWEHVVVENEAKGVPSLLRSQGKRSQPRVRRPFSLRQF